MRKTPLAEAKAKLSKLVDEVEHHGKRVVILRHGKPAAAIVPIDVALPPKTARVRAVDPQVTERSVRRFIADFSTVEPGVSAVEDLRRGRR